MRSQCNHSKDDVSGSFLRMQFFRGGSHSYSSCEYFCLSAFSLSAVPRNELLPDLTTSLRHWFAVCAGHPLVVVFLRTLLRSTRHSGRCRFRELYVCLGRCQVLHVTLHKDVLGSATWFGISPVLKERQQSKVVKFVPSIRAGVHRQILLRLHVVTRTGNLTVWKPARSLR